MSFERRAFADQLSIETPEQVALEFPVAGLGSRFMALVLDHLIQFGILFALGLIVFMLLLATHHRNAILSLSEKWFLAAAIFLLFLILWGYFSLFEAFWHGQTPGKRAMKLRVIKDSGRQITLFEALARNLLRYVDFMPSLYLTGVIAMLCNKRSKRLGDFAAGTLVVHERTETQPLLWTGSAHTANFVPSTVNHLADAIPADALAHLSARDLAVIESFFARALDLPLPVRANMANRIAAELTGKMGVPTPEGNPERVLEAIAAQLRGQRRSTYPS